MIWTWASYLVKFCEGKCICVGAGYHLHLEVLVLFFATLQAVDHQHVYVYLEIVHS